MAVCAHEEPDFIGVSSHAWLGGPYMAEGWLIHPLRYEITAFAGLYPQAAENFEILK